MKKGWVVWMLICMILLAMPGYGFAETKSDKDTKGSLVIVGGALEASNAEVYERFIALAGGKDKAKIGIIPAASGNLKSSNAFKNDLIQYGMIAENIEIIPIAVRDDKSTKDVDESKWIENAQKPEVAKHIKGYTGIWFVGGDQTTITKALLKENGKNTMALDSVWEVYNKGGVIGGTSAGAAIMSNVMIAGGSSLGALEDGFTETYTSMNDQEAGAVYIEKGLGFFPHGVIDQHFDRKARLGRLIVVAYEKGDKHQCAYGIDENTAMVVDNKMKTVEPVGKGGITVVDVSKAVKDEKSDRRSMKDIRISYVESGDVYNWQIKEYTINTKKDLTTGYEYLHVEKPMHTGVFSANGLVKNFITFDLIDNEAADQIKSYCFGDNGKGFELVFRKDEQTKGYWGYLDGGSRDFYSAVNVALDIHPIEIYIKHMGQPETMKQSQ